MIYLDANATTAVSAAVRVAVDSIFDEGPLNPSSPHQAGSNAKNRLEAARQAIADALGGVSFENVFFTSGGTEANNLVIRGFDRLHGTRVYCTAVEHASVIGPVSESTSPTVLAVGQDGILDLPRALSEIGDNGAGKTLACIQAANSETGIVQPLQEIIAAMCGADDIFIMVDAAQAFGRIPIDLGGIDALTFSGHKLHGPPGTGFLYLSDRLLEVLPPILIGGGQESGVRPGTQNVAGACGLAVAVTERMASFDTDVSKLRNLRDRLEEGILQLVPSAKVVGYSSHRVPNTSNIMFSGLDALAVLARLDAAGVLCSTGSACSSARPQGSPVLKAMGLSEREASSCLRFSVSVANTVGEVDEAARIIAACAVTDVQGSAHAG